MIKCENCGKDINESIRGKSRRWCSDSCRKANGREYTAKNIKVATDDELKGFAWKQAEDWIARFPQWHTDSINRLAEVCYRMPNTSGAVAYAEAKYLNDNRAIEKLPGFEEVYKEVMAESSRASNTR